MEKKEEPLYVVMYQAETCWRNMGKPAPKSKAEEWARNMNAMYPEIYHWCEPLPQLPEPPKLEG